MVNKRCSFADQPTNSFISPLHSSSQVFIHARTARSSLRLHVLIAGYSKIWNKRPINIRCVQNQFSFKSAKDVYLGFSQFLQMTNTYSLKENVLLRQPMNSRAYSDAFLYVTSCTIRPGFGISKYGNRMALHRRAEIIVSCNLIPRSSYSSLTLISYHTHFKEDNAIILSQEPPLIQHPLSFLNFSCVPQMTVIPSRFLYTSQPFGHRANECRLFLYTSHSPT